LSQPGTDLSSDLLLSIHGGVHATPPWTDFLALARRCFDLDYAALLFSKPNRDQALFKEYCDSERDLGEERLRYRRDFRNKDPFPYTRMAAGRVYRLPELLGVDDCEASDYYRNYLRPAGYRDMLMARVQEASGYAAWLVFSRGEARPPFGGEDSPRMGGLLPHLQIALKSFALRERTSVERSISRQITDPVELGAITIASDLRVLGVGKRARALMQDTSELRIDSSGRLQFASPSLAARFEQVIESFGDGKGEWAFQLGGEVPVEVLVAPPRSPAQTGGPAMPAAIVYLHRRGSRGRAAYPRRPSRLISLFGMTALEAAITDQLCSGLTYAEIADDLGLTSHTVRSYSKTIFAKTGTHRQSELVRLVLESIASIA
jgi:DNA-binding CsgD family transcriptional regulator